MQAATCLMVAYDTQPIDVQGLIVDQYRDLEFHLIHARLALDNGQSHAGRASCRQARAILARLIATVKDESGYEAARYLRLVYTRFLGAVMQADHEADASAIGEVLPLIAELRSAWMRPR
jgi:flagellar biosynthetic protein FliS